MEQLSFTPQFHVKTKNMCSTVWQKKQEALEESAELEAIKILSEGGYLLGTSLAASVGYEKPRLWLFKILAGLYLLFFFIFLTKTRVDPILFTLVKVFNVGREHLPYHVSMLTVGYANAPFLVFGLLMLVLGFKKIKVA